ncbi:MAG: hypothetical protein AAGU74_05280 [Bacillota bacterium]
MKRFRIKGLIAAALCALLLIGCSAPLPQSGSEEPAAAASAQPGQTNPPPKEADWVIEIDDTQQVTDEMGLVWNYKLTMYASKAGGTDALGNYTGELVLEVEPDFESARQLAASEGTELLAMLFKHHSESQDAAFEVIEYTADAYSQMMQQNNPDNPLQGLGDPGASIDGFAVSRVAFAATQEPIDMTIKDDDGDTISGTVPGRAVTVTVPVEITIEGATAYCHIYETVHPLGRSFKGVITGDV